MEKAWFITDGKNQQSSNEEPIDKDLGDITVKTNFIIEEKSKPKSPRRKIIGREPYNKINDIVRERLIALEVNEKFHSTIILLIFEKNLDPSFLIEKENENVIYMYWQPNISSKRYLFTIEKEADKIAKEQALSYAKNEGFEGYNKSFQEYIIEKCLNQRAIDFFDKTLRDLVEKEVDEVEENENDRYLGKLIDAGIIADDDEQMFRKIKFEPNSKEARKKKEEYIDFLIKLNRNSIKWFKEEFGIEELTKQLNNNSFINLDKVAEESVKKNGRGYYISSFDQTEYELSDALTETDIYYYRLA